MDPLNSRDAIRKCLDISEATFARLESDLGVPVYRAVLQKSTPDEAGLALYRNEEDLIRKLALVGGFRVELEYREFPEAFRMIAGGSVDFGALMMCKTPERSLVADFTHKYVLKNMAAAALVGISGRAVLRAKPRVGILQGTVHVGYGQFALCPSFERVYFADLHSLNTALTNGEIDYVLGFPLDLPDIQSNPRKYTVLWRHTLPYETCLPVSRGQESLRQVLNGGLRELYDQEMLTQVP